MNIWRELRSCGPPLLAGLLLLLISATALAQSNRAGISGTVKDAQGAVVGGATVTATNVATNIARETKTSDEGRYSFGSVFDPGLYTVKVEMKGFKTATSEQLILQIGDVREVNIMIEPGGAGEVVTVTAEAPLVETETSVRGEVITGRQITELPLNGRNFSSFATLIPGVSRATVGALTDASAFQGSVSGLSEGSTEAGRFSRSQGSSLSVNGLRPQNNSFSLDGVDNNEGQYGQIGVFPPPDAIQEFKVTTSVPSAEQGRGNGFIDTTFRSGGNEYHGSGYYYHRNDFLDASPVFSRLSTTDPVTGESVVSKKPPRREHEFGFTIGGPVIIPGLYNGRNRTFFFGDYQGQRNTFPFERGSPFTSVPTARSRNGDFSEFGGVIIDGRRVNQIPSNRIDSVARNYLNAFPLPNFPQNGVANNFLKLRNVDETIDGFDVRIDHNASDKHSLFGRFSYADQFRSRESFFDTLPAGFGAGEEDGSTRQVALGSTYAFNATTINDFKFGFTRINIGINECGVDGRCGISPTVSADLGIPNVNAGDDVLRQGGAGIGTGGNGGIEFTGDGGPFIVPQNHFYVSDKVTFIRGSHSIKAGAEARFRQVNPFDGGRTGPAKGFIGFDDSQTGNAQANMLIGRTSFSAAPQVNGPFTISYHEYSFFVQDDWKFNSRLTLNLGLRYDLFTNPTERHNRFGNYDLTSRRIIVASDDEKNLVSDDHNNLGPRIGFAYAIDSNRSLVLRGGYGLLFFQDAAEFPPLALNPPNGAPVFLGGTDQQGRPVSLSTGPPQAIGNSDPVALQEFASYRFVDPNNRTAYTQQYNLGIQWQFAPTWVLDVGYQGSSTRKLLATRNLGSGAFQDGGNATGLGLARTASGGNLAFVKAYENRAAATYNSLQMRLEKRFSRGLVMINSYTWSHTLDETSGDFGSIAEARGADGGPENPFCFRCEKGDSSFDYRHRFTSSILYDLPFGKGQPFLDKGDVLDKFVGGWQVNFIILLQSGQAFSVVTGGQGRRPDLIGDPTANIPAGLYYNPNAFAPPSGTVTNLTGNTVRFGSAGRNILRGPNRYNTDFSLFKNTSLSEGVKLQVGVEFFNIFNNVQRVVPNNFLNFKPDGTVDFGNQPGQIFNAYPQRQGQLRAKIIF
jgi:hypothetical protein